jgi:hypothetical protein
MSAPCPNVQPSPASIALSEFTLFRKLPPELRLKIWKCAMPGERFVRVTQIKRTTWRKPLPSGCMFRLTYGSERDLAHIPTILLHVCQESRTFALQRFKPFLDSPWYDIPVHFDFEGDTLLVESQRAWNFMSGQGLKPVDIDKLREVEDADSSGGEDMESLFGADEEEDEEDEDGDDEVEEEEDGTEGEKNPAAKSWKQNLKFLALRGTTCPNHESVSDFEKLSKITLERENVFGLEAIVTDHFRQAFKISRGTDKLDDLPLIKFANRIG